MCANQTGTHGNISLNGNINGNGNTNGNTNRNTNMNTNGNTNGDTNGDINGDTNANGTANCFLHNYITPNNVCYCANQTTGISQKIKIRMHRKYRKCTDK